MFCIMKSSGCKFPTRLESDVWRNLNESINRISKFIGKVIPVILSLYSPTLFFFEKEVYFSSVDGIQFNSPSKQASCLIINAHHTLEDYEI